MVTEQTQLQLVCFNCVQSDCQLKFYITLSGSICLCSFEFTKDKQNSVSCAYILVYSFKLYVSNTTVKMQFLIFTFVIQNIETNMSVQTALTVFLCCPVINQKLYLLSEMNQNIYNYNLGTDKFVLLQFFYISLGPCNSSILCQKSS